jgi:hypothetical protein
MYERLSLFIFAIIILYGSLYLAKESSGLFYSTSIGFFTSSYILAKLRVLRSFSMSIADLFLFLLVIPILLLIRGNG